MEMKLERVGEEGEREERERADLRSPFARRLLFLVDEGDGFSYIDLPQPLGRLSMAICMDINNGTDFLSPWDAYELATFVQKSESDRVSFRRC